MTTVVKGKIIRSDMHVYDGIEETVSRRDSTGGTIISLPINDAVDVLGAYGATDTYHRRTIVRCVNAIGSSRTRTLVFRPGTWEIDDNLTIGNNFTALVLGGCVFQVASGKTLTFSGPVIRHAQTWTSGSGTVTESGTRFMSGAFNFTSAVLQGATPLVFERSEEHTSELQSQSN